MEATIGIGDDIIATGMARGAYNRGKRIAFGDRRSIKWGPYSSMIFRNNPNIAPPGDERRPDVEWIGYYKGHRLYNKQNGDHWVWNYKFKTAPGEIFFDGDEYYEPNGKLILIEPNVPRKPCAPNKQWPAERWSALAIELRHRDYHVRQFEYGFPNRVASGMPTSNFRRAAALIKSARLVILPEGGLHHAAAAVGTPAVVLFGGFVPPQVLGYDMHVNLTGGAEACGKFTKCEHCIDAMNKISVEVVLAAVEKLLCR